jgi:hypothetical protein
MKPALQLLQREEDVGPPRTLFVPAQLVKIESELKADREARERKPEPVLDTRGKARADRLYSYD